MPFGFSITSGTGASTVTVSENDAAVGVYLDSFTVPYNTTVTRTYSSFIGTDLAAFVTNADQSKLNVPTITINNPTKTVTIVSNPSASTNRQSDLRVVILGR